MVKDGKRQSESPISTNFIQFPLHTFLHFGRVGAPAEDCAGRTLQRRNIQAKVAMRPARPKNEITK